MSFYEVEEGVREEEHASNHHSSVKEAEMRTVSEKTNGKVAWLSIISLAMCIAVFWFAIVQFEAVCKGAENL
ncbi:hypothetical protein JHK87_027098 [Glycine soja]|nr:hypothetical protein JHK87_027098 [Glycine soja]